MSDISVTLAEEAGWMGPTPQRFNNYRTPKKWPKMAISEARGTSSKPDFWGIHLSFRRCRQNYPPVSVAIAGRSPISFNKRYTSSFMVGIVHCHVSFGHMIATSAKITEMAWQNTLPETNSSHLKT